MAAQPVVMVGAVGIVGVGPHGWAAGLSAALRPGAEPLRAQDVLGDADLLGARGGRGTACAAVGGPGGLLELQAAVWPLPVLVDQLPPDSHWAMASQFTVSALAVPVERAIGTTPSAPAMAVANRPLVTALGMFISAVLPRPFETRPAVRNLCVLPMRLSGVSGDEHHVLRECQKFYSLLNWCKRPLRKKRRCRAKAQHRLCSLWGLAAPAADRPRPDALRTQNVLGNSDLLITAGVLR